MKRIFLFLMPVMLVFASQVNADEEGRYRAVVLQQSGGSESHGKVFILDSEEGHMWTWEDKSKFTTRNGGIGFGAKITYQGQLKPGKEMGEIVGRGAGR